MRLPTYLCMYLGRSRQSCDDVQSFLTFANPFDLHPTPTLPCPFPTKMHVSISRQSSELAIQRLSPKAMPSSPRHLLVRPIRGSLLFIIAIPCMISSKRDASLCLVWILQSQAPHAAIVTILISITACGPSSACISRPAATAAQESLHLPKYAISFSSRAGSRLGMSPVERDVVVCEDWNGSLRHFCLVPFEAQRA